MTKLNFEFVKFTKSDNDSYKLFDEQKNELSKLFCNLTDGNIMFVLSPNEVLSNEILDRYRDEGFDFDYSQVNLPKTTLSNTHKYYWYLTQNQSYNDTYNTLKHDVKYAMENRNISNPSYSYFIVEEDKNFNHIVRGIAKGTKEDFSFCLNPEHKQRVDNKNNNVYDWSLKFSDDIEPEDSLEKYQTKITEYLNTTNHTFPNTNPNSGRDGR